MFTLFLKSTQPNRTQAGFQIAITLFVGGHMKAQQQKVIIICLSTLLIISFQNCAQNASSGFVQNPNFDVASTEEIPAEVPVDMPVPAAEVKYQVHSKVITASETTTASKVDVLVVIDNSKSMEYEQTNMGQRFDSFLNQLQGIDWQVGIITTDVSVGTAATTDGRLLQYSSGKNLISAKDNLTTAKSLFAKTIKRSEIGGSNEQGIKASYRALERASTSGDANNALIRSNAALAVIVVSDADETGSTTQNNPDTLHQYITKKYPGKSFKFHSIIVKNGDSTCLNNKSTITTASGSSYVNQNEGYGATYTKLSQQTSGIIGSVCQADYGNQLQAIGQSTVEQVKQATLDCAPVDRDNNGYADIEIRNAKTNSLITNYVVKGLQITFDQPLASGSYNVSYVCVAK